MEEYTYEFRRTKEQKLGPIAGTTAVLWFPAILPVGAFASLASRSSPPGFLASWFLLVLMWCCSESEDSVINLRNQHSNCLWLMFCFLLESTSGLVAIHSVHKQFVPAHLANEQVTSVKQILFLWGHDPNALAFKARPSFDGCGTSLSVSLSLSLS